MRSLFLGDKIRQPTMRVWRKRWNFRALSSNESGQPWKNDSRVFQNSIPAVKIYLSASVGLARRIFCLLIAFFNQKNEIYFPQKHFLTLFGVFWFVLSLGFTSKYLVRSTLEKEKLSRREMEFRFENMPRGRKGARVFQVDAPGASQKL